jgi:peptidyl-prolyl cis-trans isomerase D
MLQKIRDKITGLVALAFLGLISVVFVFWGVDFGSSAQTYAARVDGEKIPAETVRRAWQQRQSQLQQMLRGDLPSELIKAQQTALLDQFITQALLRQRAEDFGYRVNDHALVERIMEIPQFQVDGAFSKDRYVAVLRSAGMTEAQFEAELHGELLIGQIQDGILQSAFVAPYELDRRYAIEQQARELDYALIPASQFAASIEVTDEQIQKWYDDHPSDFLLPETVDLQYVELTRAQAEAAVEVTEQALKDYYAQVKDRFESPERRHARHILITTEDGVSDEAARKKAEELTAKAQAGADFAQLARENSKDAGSAQQGGDLGWAQRGMFVGPFEDALFGMKAGEIRGPVKTQFGYHVLKLEDVEQGKQRSFDEARADIEAEFRKERSQTIFYDETQKLGDMAFSALTELESVAQALNLPIQTVNDFTREGGGALDANPDVIEAAFSEEVLERRQNSPLITIGEDRALVLRVTDHTPTQPRALADVRAEIQELLHTQGMRDAAAQKGADAIARLHKGEPWTEVAAATGVAPVGKRFVTREDKLAPAAVLQAAFDVPQGEIGEATPYYAGVRTDDGNYAVYAVTQVRDGDPTAEPEQARTNRRLTAERQIGGEEFTGYLAEAERNADIERNEKVFE